ncbi:MAG: anti-sigma factor family protein [Blastocatellia bacterium]
MDCEFTTKVSLMIDGALSPAETDQMERHLASCRQCPETLEDFLSLRSQIKSLAPERDRLAARRTLARIMSPGPAPIWRRRLSVPVPAMTFMLAVFLALSAWSLSLRRQSTGGPSIGSLSAPPAGKTADGNTAGGKTAAGFDLSRFGHDEPPVIVKVRLDRQGNASGGGNAR